jgi:uncharacterized membrane protein YphA (DoxX/SURF4 family)
VALACRYALAVVFLMAAVTKVTDLTAFEDRLVLSSGLAPALALPAARFLPWLELTLGACLVLGYAVREASFLAGVLLGLFLVYGVLRPAESDCGCFLFPTLRPAPPGWWQPARNLLLLACAMVCFRTARVPSESF